MKKIILTSIIGLAILVSCTNNAEQNNEARYLNFAEMIDVPTTMEFEDMNFDFGVITDGDKVSKVFTFENTGDEDLILLNVKASCGCTVPENWPKYPISPGDTGEIEVSFNSVSKLGKTRKTIRIEANTLPTVTMLTITGVVEPVK